MQRVSSLLPSWDWNRSSVSSFANNNIRNSADKVRPWSDRIPSTRSSRQAKEALWPATLDKECEKAARILKSFCSDGFATLDEQPGSPLTSSSTQSSRRTLKKIPPKLIQNAVGMAIFTSMRSGLWASGPGGSGILIARRTDGSWSPPSGLVLHTPSLGFVIGVDVYDCVLLINNFTVLEAFARPKLTLGTDVILHAGPLVSLGLLENDVTWTDLSDAAVTYVKSSGQFSEIKLEGTVLQERKDENERFYGMTLGVAKILSGDINQSLPQLRSLTEVLKAAEGRVDYDATLVESLSSHSASVDVTVESPATLHSPTLFGLPAADDPDPFGVLALEVAGVGIREVGTHLRPESNQLGYHQNPASPAFPKAKRGSIDTIISCSNRSGRGSYMSNRTVGTERSQMTDVCAPTFSMTPATTPPHSQSQSEDGYQHHSSDELQEVKESGEFNFAMIDIASLRKLSNFPDLDEPITLLNNNDSPVCDGVKPKIDKDEKKESKHERRGSSVLTVEEYGGDGDDEEDRKSRVCKREDDLAEDDRDSDTDDGLDDDDDDDNNNDDDDDDDEEEAVVIEVATAQAPTRATILGTQVMQAKGAVVNIPKRVPPPLPTRSPARASRRRSQMPDIGSMVSSPLRNEFDPNEVSGIAAHDTLDTLESTNDVVEDEILKTPINATVAKESSHPIDFQDSPATRAHELPAKRASGMVHAAAVEEQANLVTDHRPTVAVT
ncbi:hypothetical protein GGS21DRAFT_538983 [Xylaria nigripes]|nr:hypothetical protein GGS21DRAFT_538983 [Xylaria nigripes]